MIQKTFSLTLDVKKGVVETPVIVVKGDTGSVLKIRLQDDGTDIQLAGATVTACFRGAAGAYTEGENEGVTKSGAVVTVPLLPAAVSEGTNSCDVQIYTENGTLITSAAFTFECRAATCGDDAVAADRTLPVVLDLLRRVEEAAEKYPSVALSEIPGGVRVTVTDAAGHVTSADVLHGKSGVYTGGGEMPEGCFVQIDPDGETPAFVQEPAEEGAAGQALVTDGEGGRSWQTVGGAGSYSGLADKPKINGTELAGNKTAAALGLAALSDVSGKQDALVSGVTLRTVNGQSLLGAGNLAAGAPVKIWHNPDGGAAMGAVSVTTADPPVNGFRFIYVVYRVMKGSTAYSAMEQAAVDDLNHNMTGVRNDRADLYKRGVKAYSTENRIDFTDGFGAVAGANGVFTNTQNSDYMIPQDVYAI